MRLHPERKKERKNYIVQIYQIYEDQTAKHVVVVSLFTCSKVHRLCKRNCSKGQHKFPSTLATPQPMVSNPTDNTVPHTPWPILQYLWVPSPPSVVEMQMETET
jgi:hypothetical protein